MRARVEVDENGTCWVDSEGESSENPHVSETEWPEPQPLSIKVPPEPFPLDDLPASIKDAITEVHGFVKAPLPMVVSSALGAISLVIQAHFDVRRDEVLLGPISLFLLTIADSGERKTQADKMFMQPILDFEDECVEAAKPGWANHLATLEAWESKKSGIKDHIRQLAKGGKSTVEAEKALCDLERAKPQKPRVPKLLREDCTPEGLAKKLEMEWPSAGVISSEAGIVFGAHGMNKESVMRNLALLNKLWDGGRYQSDRSDDERSRNLRGARLTMSLMVQEATLREFFDQSKGLARGTGFLARFLVAWPDSTMGTRFYAPPSPGMRALKAFHKVIIKLAKSGVPMDENGALKPADLTLSDDAKTAWIVFHDVIEAELGSGGEMYDVRDVASKIADNAVRLAGLFHVFSSESSGNSSSSIPVETFAAAARIALWYLHECRRFLGELYLPADLGNAIRLDTWLIEHCRRESVTSVSKNYIRQRGPNPIRDKARLDAACNVLDELSRVRLYKDGRKVVVEVNPALLENNP